MEKYYLVGSNCQILGFYNQINKEYDTPFIGNFIQDDLQYLKFCKNYNYYINLTPVFGKCKLPFEYIEDINRDTFPTMYLGDIEINWIHEKDEAVCLEKFNRRLNRAKNKTPFFIWADSLLHQYHTESDRLNLISEFKKIPNSLYIHKESCSEWDNCQFTDRTPTRIWAEPVKWQRPDLINQLMYSYLSEGSDKLPI
jgi:uncharacterized protein (DUF1919 family)